MAARRAAQDAADKAGSRGGLRRLPPGRARSQGPRTLRAGSVGSTSRLEEERSWATSGTRGDASRCCRTRSRRAQRSRCRRPRHPPLRRPLSQPASRAALTRPNRVMAATAAAPTVCGEHLRDVVAPVGAARCGRCARSGSARTGGCSRSTTIGRSCPQETRRPAGAHMTTPPRRRTAAAATTPTATSRGSAPNRPHAPCLPWWRCRDRSRSPAAVYGPALAGSRRSWLHPRVNDGLVARAASAYPTAKVYRSCEQLGCVNSKWPPQAVKVGPDQTDRASSCSSGTRSPRWRATSRL